MPIIFINCRISTIDLGDIMNMNHSALLLIEFQNEWLDQQGKLNKLMQDREQFLTSLKNAEEILKAARNTSIHIVHSGLHFTSTYKELGKAKLGLRARIANNGSFLQDSEAVQFTDPFKPKNNEFIIQGRIGASAFSGSNLDAYLRNNEIKTLYIMGYALHVCVESTLRAAHDLGYETIVIEDASSAFSQEQKEYFLAHIVDHFGSKITSTDFLSEIVQSGENNND